jgi:hypothetical protein
MGKIWTEKKFTHAPWLVRKHRPAFLQLLKMFLKILAKFIDFWGAESKTELKFFYHVPFPKNLHCQLLQLYVHRVNEFNEEMCSNKR